MTHSLTEQVKSLNGTKDEFTFIKIIGEIYSKYGGIYDNDVRTNLSILTEDEFYFINEVRNADLDSVSIGSLTLEDGLLKTLFKYIKFFEELDGVDVFKLYGCFVNTSFPLENYVRYNATHLSAHQLKKLILVYIYVIQHFNE